MSERLKRKSTPSLADLSSPSVRRTSNSIRPIALKSPGRRKSSPLSVNKSLSTIKLSPINVTFTPVIAEVDSPKVSHEHEQNKTDDRIEDKVCEIIQVPQLSGIKPLINETLKNTNKENSLSIVTTPKLPRKEVVSPTFRLKRSNLLSDLGKIFNNVPVDQFMEGVKEDSFDEMTFCGQLMPLEEEPAEEKSNEELTESTLIKYMCESWKMLTSAQERRDKLYDVKCSFGSRIIQICDNVYRGLDSLNTRSPDFKGMVELFLSLSNLFELSRCWLANYPTESAISYQQTLTKLFKSAEDSINQLNDSGSNAKRTAQRYLMKLVFLIGKRLLEVNSSLEEKVWTILMEDVQDNLAKGSSTQFSVTLHTVIDQVSKSLMNVSSMSHQAFVTKKSEPIRSLLETSIELLDELQQVMKKFKIWHEFHNGENTMTKMYELQFLWHSENYQYLNLLYSLIIDYTKNIIKVIEESGCITELPLLEKILSSIKTNLNGIQSSLPFSSDNEADGDNVSESVKLLNDLEQAIRQSSTIILKQRNLITTSFICCKGILKSLPTYNPSPALELSIQSNEAESETGNYNRRVHFSNSITETATGEEK
ncbi:uncharacterized protein LOC107367721 isoform X2 [Tetranychus urticae]|uniref:uncharacterized protein LOC107367721 isoform X2 n=1 Tax=Tetranychus urticae TaxID=32264 RepID=UPI00077BE5B7|nr:uncharacterized protein LOC107367721 isoform X2 [Tetranychus urticae]